MLAVKCAAFPCRSRAFALCRALALLCVVGGSLAAQPTVLIKEGDAWKYFKGTVAPPADWKSLAFNDAAWLEGPTGIGYADGDDATQLLDMQQTATQTGYMAFFARKTFSVASLASVQRLILGIDFDDGFVAYLNGTEVARQNLGNAGDATAFDAAAPAGREAGTAVPIDIGVTSLRAGTNVLAIELHNNGIGSSDASLIPELIANGSIGPSGLTCVRTGTTVSLAWDNEGNYSSVRVLKNGVLLQTLAGSAEAHTDSAFDGLDTDYQIVGIEGGEEYPSATCRVGCTAGTLTCTLAVVGGQTQATLRWTGVPAGATAIDITREGAALATIPGTDVQYVDPDVEGDGPEDDTGYTVIVQFAGGRSCTMACAASLCPANLSARAVGNSIELRWENVVRPWDHFEVSRGGAVIDAAVPGTATSWTDTSVVLEVGTSYDYVVHPVSVPGNDLPAPGTQCDLALSYGYAPELGSFDPPAGGWDYELKFTGLARPQYSATTGTKGNLDGQWIRSINRDLWDGTDAADADIGPPPQGPGPGGVDIVARPGLGACGSSTSVLRILDPGDAGQPIGTTFPQGFDAPNNSRILLGYDAGEPAQNLIRSGFTLLARLRTSPDAPAYMNPNASSGDGAPFSNGIGHIGLYHRAPGGAGPNLCASFALNSGGNGGDLQFSAEPMIDVDGIGVGNFIAIWLTVEEGTTAGTYDVNVYLNGSLTPASEVSAAGLSLQAGHTDPASFPNFGDTVSNFVAIGSNGTADDAMIEVDHIAFKKGVFPPGRTPCQGGEGSFRRGDATDDGQVNITDGIYTLNFLFLGGPQPVCLDASDSNGDGTVNITDGILLLNFLFLGGPPPNPPGTETCGPDDAEDELTPCLSAQC